MPRYIALLRGVNVGGQKMVPMATLKAVVEELGHTDVKTLLQSGNVVFSAPKMTPAQLGQDIHRELAATAGVTTDVFVLTAADLAETMATNPYPEAAAQDPSHLLLSFLSANVTAAKLGEIDPKYVKNEEMTVVGSTLYIWYRHGVGTSKLTGAVIEKALGDVRTTARNWNTVVKLSILADSVPG